MSGQTKRTSASAMPKLPAKFGTMVALSLGPLVATSFARFAYALVLPSMRSSLDLTFSEAGSLNTSNALGYLLGSLIAMRFVNAWGNRRLYSVGLIVTVLALVGSAVADDFAAQIALRALAGAGGALVFICGVVLASNLFPNRPQLASIAVATYFAGAGAGIVLSAFAVPAVFAMLGEDAWRQAWLVIALMSSVFAAFSIRAASKAKDPVAERSGATWPVGEFRASLASYFLFGLGYIGYMTFMVASMVAKGASHLDVVLTWATLGLAAMFAPLVWRSLRARWPAPRMLALIGGVITVGTAIPLYSASRSATMLSALLFGVAMFSVPASVTDIVKSALPKPAWGRAVALFTVLFAIGQMLGPIFAGWLADRTHSLNATLEASTVILLSASLIALFQRENAPSPVLTSTRGKVAI